MTSRVAWRAVIRRSRAISGNIKNTALAHSEAGSAHFHDDAENLHSLTRQRLSEMTGFDQHTVRRHLAWLESHGWLIRHTNGHRGSQTEFHYQAPDDSWSCDSCQPKGGRKGGRKGGEREAPPTPYPAEEKGGEREAPGASPSSTYVLQEAPGPTRTTHSSPSLDLGDTSPITSAPLPLAPEHLNQPRTGPDYETERRRQLTALEQLMKGETQQ